MVGSLSLAPTRFWALGRSTRIPPTEGKYGRGEEGGVPASKPRHHARAAARVPHRKASASSWIPSLHFPGSARRRACRQAGNERERERVMKERAKVDGVRRGGRTTPSTWRRQRFAVPVCAFLRGKGWLNASSAQPENRFRAERVMVGSGWWSWRCRGARVSRLPSNARWGWGGDVGVG